MRGLGIGRFKGGAVSRSGVCVYHGGVHGAVNRGSVRHLSWRTRIGTLEDYYIMYAKGHRFDFLFFIRATIDKRTGSPLMEFWYGTRPYGTVALDCICV